MKRLTLLLILLPFLIDGICNINYIDVNKISQDEKIIDAYNYVMFNQTYYEAWSNNWEYDIPKEKIVKELKHIYSTVSSLTNKNEELFLFLGDISHYLYNLDDSLSYQLAIENYNNAIKINPKDYRCYWFLGYHYSLSNVPTKAINLFIESIKYLPKNTPIDFWEEYATASYYSGMKFNASMAMDKTKEILGSPGQFENMFGELVSQNIIQLDKNKDYTNKEIWQLSKEDKIGFVSMPLGLKINLDSVWNVSIPDYKNHQTAFIIQPSEISNKKGKSIGYSIAVLIKTANDNEKLDDYITKLSNNDKGKNKINFSNKYDNIIAYEITDDKTYERIGGGKFILVGIERNYPKYPGVALEIPMSLKNTNQGEINYFALAPDYSRFKGKIFYVVLLDTCGDIYEKSYSVFNDFFENNIIIE